MCFSVIAYSTRSDACFTKNYWWCVCVNCPSLGHSQLLWDPLPPFYNTLQCAWPFMKGQKWTEKWLESKTCGPINIRVRRLLYSIFSHSAFSPISLSLSFTHCWGSLYFAQHLRQWSYKEQAVARVFTWWHCAVPRLVPQHHSYSFF